MDWREAELRAEHERERELQARTIDTLRIGEMQPEREHQLAGESTGAGEHLGRKWRHATDGGWFAFDMGVVPEGANTLLCTYWGSEVGPRTFDILVDGHKIAEQTLAVDAPGKFFDVTYAIPRDLTRGKSKDHGACAGSSGELRRRFVRLSDVEERVRQIAVVTIQCHVQHSIPCQANRRRCACIMIRTRMWQLVGICLAAVGRFRQRTIPPLLSIPMSAATFSADEGCQWMPTGDEIREDPTQRPVPRCAATGRGLGAVDSVAPRLSHFRPHSTERPVRGRDRHAVRWRAGLDTRRTRLGLGDRPRLRVRTVRCAARPASGGQSTTLPGVRLAGPDGWP